MIQFTEEKNPFDLDIEEIEQEQGIDLSIQLKQRRIDELEKQVKHLKKLLKQYEDQDKTAIMLKDQDYKTWDSLLKKLNIPVNPYTLEHAEAIQTLEKEKEHRVEYGIFAYLKKYGKLSQKQQNVMYGVVERAEKEQLKKQGVKV